MVAVKNKIMSVAKKNSSNNYSNLKRVNNLQRGQKTNKQTNKQKNNKKSKNKKQLEDNIIKAIKERIIRDILKFF